MADQPLLRTIRHLAVAVTLTVLTLHNDAAAAQTAAAKSWDAYIKDFIEATFKAQPQHAV